VGGINFPSIPGGLGGFPKPCPPLRFTFAITHL